MIKAVIFDLDDTLCNTTEVVEDALRSVFTKHIIHFPDKSVDELIVINVKTFESLISDTSLRLPSATIRVWFEVFEQLEIKASLKVILKLIEDVRKEVSRKVRLFDGALELMTYLKGKNIKICVLTNGIFVDQASKLIKLKIDNFVDVLVTSDIHTAGKPDLSVFKYVLNKMAVLPSQALMIGNDYVEDIQAAHAVGLTTIYLKNNRTLDVNRKTAEADYIKTNYKDILRLIKKLTTS